MERKNGKIFYCDGSCIPNPGPGGTGFYSPNFIIKSKIFIIDHDTTINYCELMGVDLILSTVSRYIKFCNKRKISIDFNDINIYTDSSFVMNMMDKDSYPKIDYYYDLIQSIFKKCNILEKMNVNVNILKVKGHIGDMGNRMADSLAKEAANIAKMCKSGESNIVHYHMRKNHVTVDITKDLIQLRKREKEQRKYEWEKMKMDRIDGKKNRYFGDGIFEKSIIEKDRINNRTNDMKKELKFLSKQECEIISKLRMEQINLNDYLHFIDNNLCDECRHCSGTEKKIKETVNHYLIDCPGFKEPVIRSLNRNNIDFNVERNKLKKKLKKIDIFFKNPSNFTTINILFPHTWQRRLGNPNKEKDNDNKRVEKRVQILKVVVQFVRATKRFKTDKGY